MYYVILVKVNVDQKKGFDTWRTKVCVDIK